MSYLWQGVWRDSKEENLIDRDVIEPAGLNHVYNQPIWCGCCQTNNRRRVDWMFPCSDGHHAVVWEHSSMLQDNLEYLEKFLRYRLVFYERHQDRYALIITDRLEDGPIAHAMHATQELMADGGQRLHALLRAEGPRESLEFYRKHLTARRDQLRDALLTWAA